MYFIIWGRIFFDKLTLGPLERSEKCLGMFQVLALLLMLIGEGPWVVEHPS